MTKQEVAVKETNKIVIILLICAFIIVLGFFAWAVIKLNATPEMVQVSNIFIDVNGDGTLDYIYKADVILNTGQKNFP